MSLHHAPQQNVTYADREGNIGFISAGRIPIRPRSGGQQHSGPHSDGNLPVRGWDGSTDWLGTIPPDEWPRVFNPPAGLIINANNAVVGSDYP